MFLSMNLNVGQPSMGWLRFMFRAVRREHTNRTVPWNPLTLLRAAHCQQAKLGQAVFRRTDALRRTSAGMLPA
jgi:hypothetical protein